MFRPAGLSDSSSLSEDGFDDFESPKRRKGGRKFREPNKELYDFYGNNNASQDLEVTDEKDQKLLERTKKCIRSTLLASKGSTEVYELDREYFDMFEENIPFSRFGFKSLDDFLKSIPSVCRVRQMGFSTYVEGVADAGTRHIKMMVSAQKTNGGGKKKRGRGPRFDIYTPSIAPRQPAVRRPVPTSRVAPPGPKVIPPSKPVPRPIPAVHKREPNTLLASKLSTSTASATSSSTTTKPKSSMMNSILKCSSSNATSDNEVLLNVVKKYLRSVLLSTKQASMSLEKLEIEYLRLTNENIPFEKLGFQSLSEFLMSDSNVCKVMSHNGHCLVSAVSTPETLDMQTMIAANGVRSEKKKGGVNRALVSAVSSALPKLQEVTMVATTDTDTMFSRIKELLKGRKFGLMITQLVKMYEKRFDEKLPDNWRDEAVQFQLVIEEKGNAPPVIRIQEAESCDNDDSNGNNIEEVIQNKLEQMNVTDIVSKVVRPKECELGEEKVEALRNILEPRKFGLFKKQVEKMFEKNTGIPFEDSWWVQLEEAGLVTVTMVVKWNNL